MRKLFFFYIHRVKARNISNCNPSWIWAWKINRYITVIFSTEHLFSFIHNQTRIKNHLGWFRTYPKYLPFYVRKIYFPITECKEEGIHFHSNFTLSLEWKRIFCSIIRLRWVFYDMWILNLYSFFIVFLFLYSWYRT